jgi:TPR repeat protein
MYAAGQAVSENQPEAVKWFLLSAAQGNADAQYFLGQEYSMGGGGIERDAPEAYFWLVLTIENKATYKRSLDSATQLRDLIAGKLTPEQLAKVEKRLADWRAIH